MSADVDAARAALYRHVGANSEVDAFEAAVRAESDSAYRLALMQIEHDGQVINRLKEALRIASHSPHDRLGEPNEGFPVCSICGAIQTQPDAEAELAALREAVRTFLDGPFTGGRYIAPLRAALDATETE